jgi:hypothetical protein
LAAAAELEAQRAQLAAEVQQLREQAAGSEALARQLEEARQQLAGREAQLLQQQAEIAHLRGSISEQRQDICSALSLVARRAPAPAPPPHHQHHHQGGTSLGSGQLCWAAGPGPGAASARAQTSYSDPLLRSPAWDPLQQQHQHQQHHGFSPPQHLRTSSYSAYPSAGGEQRQYIHSAQSSPYRPLSASPVRHAAGAGLPAQASPPFARTAAAAAAAAAAAGASMLPAYQGSPSPAAAPGGHAGAVHATAATAYLHTTHSIGPGSLAAARAAAGPAGLALGARPGIKHISQLRQDMQSLDDEIAGLEASLRSAALGLGAAG